MDISGLCISRTTSACLMTCLTYASNRICPLRYYGSRPVGPPPPPSSVAISKAMRSNRSSGTKPELLLSKLLQRRLAKSNLPGSPDFVYSRAKIAVFCHGDWWHRCPVCNIPLPRRHRGYWERKLNRNVERDRLNRKELRAMGWRVIEIWEHEVRANPEKAANRVQRLLKRT